MIRRDLVVPVFRLGSTNHGGLPPTAKKPRPVASYQSSSTRSVSSFAGGLRRTAGNWSFNASFRNLNLVNGGDSARGNVGSARVFVTPDSPEGYAPKSPPEQEAPRHPDDVEAPTKFVDVTTAADIDIVACPRFFVPPTSQARKTQPPHYNPYPSPAYSVSKGLGLGVHEVHDSEFVTATQPESQPNLAKNGELNFFLSFLSFFLSFLLIFFLNKCLIAGSRFPRAASEKVRGRN